MKKYLNTLYVTTQGAYLNKEGESLLVNIEHEVKLRVPIHTLGSVVCFGSVMCSPYLMHHCAKNSVAMAFLSERGRFLARVEGPVSGNVLLRCEQCRRADDEAQSLEVARPIVMAKANNCRAVLRRRVRDYGETEALTVAIMRLDHVIKEVQTEPSLESLRGKEGDAGRVYFSAFNDLIREQDGFTFTTRSRRPPMDRINALLSFVYVLLAHDCAGALQGVGLDPQVGFLHRLRPGRSSLALDLMEEFRSFFADRLVLSLINLKQVNKKGFNITESGAVEMTDETRKTVLVAYQKRKQEELMHPFVKEKALLGICFHIQAQLLARYLRGDLDGYPPMLWK